VCSGLPHRASRKAQKAWERDVPSTCTCTCAAPVCIIIIPSVVLVARASRCRPSPHPRQLVRTAGSTSSTSISMPVQSGGRGEHNKELERKSTRLLWRTPASKSSLERSSSSIPHRLVPMLIEGCESDEGVEGSGWWGTPRPVRDARRRHSKRGRGEQGGQLEIDTPGGCHRVSSRLQDATRSIVAQRARRHAPAGG